jgi:hypothetical protein
MELLYLTSIVTNSGLVFSPPSQARTSGTTLSSVSGTETRPIVPSDMSPAVNNVAGGDQLESHF